MTEKTSAGQIAIYDRCAPEFDVFASDSPTWKYVEAPAFDRYIGAYYRCEMPTLDLVCGTGRLTAHLTRQGMPSRCITGVDASKEMLARARKYVPRANFVLQNLLHLNLPERNHRLAVANMLFESFDNDDLGRAMLKIREHLRPGACFFYVVTHPLRHAADSAQYLERGWQEVTTPWGSTLHNFCRPVADYLNATTKAGFRIESVDELG